MFSKFINKLKNELQNHTVILVEGVYFKERKSILKENFPTFEYVSFSDDSFQKLILNDPLRFFKVYTSNVLFDNIELIPDFLELFQTYFFGLYHGTQTILVSNAQLEETNNLKKITYLSPQLIYDTNFSNFQSNLENCILNVNHELKSNINYEAQINFIFSKLIARDVHQSKLNTFKEILILCASEIDKPLNVNSLAKKIQLTQPTVQKCLDLFEKYGLLIFLPNLNESFGKRTIKSSKLYFSDTGLACYLLKIKDSKTLVLSNQFNELFSNFIFTLLYKKLALEDKKTNNKLKKLFYWRESNGHEIKLLSKNPTSFDIYEFTSHHLISRKDKKELDFFDEISDGKVLSKTIIYAGYKTEKKENEIILPWTNLI